MASTKFTRRGMLALAAASSSATAYAAGGEKIGDANPSVPAGAAALHPQTAAELAASVTPTNHSWPPGNVLRYGATGNGSTDDTAAIQQALNCTQPSALANAEIYLPPGIYIISSPLTVPNYVTLKGAAKRIYPNFTTDWQTAIPSWGYSASTIQYARGSHGAILSGGSNSEYFGLVFRSGQARNSSDCVWAVGQSPSALRMHACVFQNLDHIASNSSGAYGAWQFYSNQLTGLTSAWSGVLVDMEIWGNGFTSFLGNVFNLQSGAASCGIFGNRFEFGGLPAILINSGARQHRIRGNIFDAHLQCAIYLNSADAGQIISDNLFNRNCLNSGGATSGTGLQSSCHIYMVSTGDHIITDNTYEVGQPDSPATCTITIASSRIRLAQRYNAGLPVVFATTGTLPTGITAGTTYFVSATGLTTRSFEISSTFANAIAGTSITLSGTQSGVQSVAFRTPLFGIGLESCINTGATQFSGFTRNGCIMGQFFVDRFGTSNNAIRAIGPISLPAGVSPGTSNDDFTSALGTINQICVEPVTVDVYENRSVNTSPGILSRVNLRGLGSTAPTLTNSGGNHMGFQSMDNINYGALTYTLRRGMQYASAQPNTSRTQGWWRVGDHIWNSAPPASGTLGWVLTSFGPPDTWTAVTIP